MEDAYGVESGLWYSPSAELWFAWSDMTKGEARGDIFEAESKRMRTAASEHWEIIKIQQKAQDAVRDEAVKMITSLEKEIRNLEGESWDGEGDPREYIRKKNSKKETLRSMISDLYTSISK